LTPAARILFSFGSATSVTGFPANARSEYMRQGKGWKRGGRRLPGARRVVRYLTRYLTRDFCNHVPRRVRLASGRASNKVGTTRPQCSNGLAKAWRVGCEGFLHATKINPPTIAWPHRDHILLEHDHVLCGCGSIRRRVRLVRLGPLPTSGQVGVDR
jgi:hypothetical protein